MHKFLFAAIPIVLVATGCRKTPEPFEGEGPFEEGPSEWEPLEPEADEGPVGEDRGLEGLPEAEAPMEYREAVSQLREATEQYRQSTEVGNEELVRGLRALGDAVASFTEIEDREQFLTDIRTFSDQIQVSDPTSGDQVTATAKALRQSANALERVVNQRNVEGLDDRLAVINDQIDLLDAQRPLAEQREVVAAALSQMSDVLQYLEPQRTGTR